MSYPTSLHNIIKYLILLCTILVIAITTNSQLKASGFTNNKFLSHETQNRIKTVNNQPKNFQETIVEALIPVKTRYHLNLLQQLGLPCEHIGVCDTELTNEDITLLGINKIEFEVIARAIRATVAISKYSIDEIKQQESYIYAANETDNPMQLWENDQIVTISTAPTDARITRIRYSLRVQHDRLGDTDMYLTYWGSSDCTESYTLWRENVIWTDGGTDDDPEDDNDIDLRERWINDFDCANGEVVNGTYFITVYDYIDNGYSGYIDYFRIWVYYESPATCETPSTPPLSLPDNGSITNDASPTLNWDAANYANQYQLQVDNNDSFSIPHLNVATSSTSYTPSSNLSDGTYYWRVRGRNNSSGCDIYGDWSSIRSFTIDTTGPGSPSLVAPNNGSTVTDNTPLFDWDAVSGAALYQLQVDNSSSFSSPNIDTERSNTSYTPGSSLSDGTYYWRVRARDSVGNWGNWSSTWSFTIGAQAVISFSSSSFMVNEAGGFATITLQRSGVSSSSSSVTFSTGGGTATAVSDYTPTNTTLTFAPGQLSATTQIVIINDTIDENNETINLTLSNPGNAILGSPSSSVLTIIDNDAQPTQPSTIFLPFITRGDPYFGSSFELEPNNSAAQANGRLRSNQPYYGYPNDAKDYFYIYVDKPSQITVDLQNYTATGQLQLFHQAADAANRVAFDIEPPYHIDYTGAAGTYYIYIATTNGFNSNVPYELTVAYNENPYFEGPWEQEDNDSAAQANGRLRSNHPYFGYPNDNKDYFYIYVDKPSQITVDLQNYTATGQLQLFHQAATVANRVAFDDTPPYHIDHTGPAGTYYIYIATVAGHNSTNRYTLTVTYE